MESALLTASLSTSTDREDECTKAHAPLGFWRHLPSLVSAREDVALVKFNSFPCTHNCKIEQDNLILCILALLFTLFTFINLRFANRGVF